VHRGEHFHRRLRHPSRLPCAFVSRLLTRASAYAAMTTAANTHHVDPGQCSSESETDLAND
jgi:hypothetical protein